MPSDEKDYVMIQSFKITNLFVEGIRFNICKIVTINICVFISSIFKHALALNLRFLYHVLPPLRSHSLTTASCYTRYI